MVKVASTPFAQPGDEVDFTIRFDNVGDQTIGNVTIVDSLNTRLEYVPDSAQCSVDAQFSTQPNEGDSVVVRCEVTNPLEARQGRHSPLPLPRAIAPPIHRLLRRNMCDAQWAADSSA